jgi:hypothetical protein
MKKPFNDHTEPISALLDEYCASFSDHPLFLAAGESRIPPAILREFAFYQYADSILWIPMLALMKSKATRSQRLRRAIEENIACEAGLGNTSHVHLAANLMRSLSIFGVESFPVETFERSASLWLSRDFAEFSEPEIAGWLLVAETLVPIMFARMKDAFARLEGCDTTYFSEHVSVDSDEHSTWMREAVDDVIELYGSDGAARAMTGMKDAWLESLEVPDRLQEKLCVSR